MLFFFVKQKTAYEMRISDWSSDVCSSDLACGTAPLFLVRVRLDDFKQFNLEHQGGIRRNRAAGRTGLAVAEFARDPQLVLAAHRHQLHAFGPARRHLLQREHGRLAALVRTVELRTVEQDRKSTRLNSSH